MTDFQKKYTPNNIQQESLAQQNRKNLWSNKGRKTAKEKNTVTIVQTPIELEPHTTSYEQFFWLIKEDAIARYLRMMGKQVNTCPIFSYKTTTSDGEKENIKMPQWERLMTKEKEKWIKYMIQLGFAYDETSEKTIFSPLYMRKIRNLIVHFTQKGWIYKDYAINYRSNRLQTNIASDDIVRKRIKDKIYNIRYFVDTKNITIVVSTTTPETIFGDVALAVHPEDRRYKKLIGSKVIIPIINKTIPIIADEAVDAGSENGIIRVTPCHDKLGLDIAKRHNLKLNKFAIDHQ
jgi:valyl-tRNA synthetase